MEAMVESSPGLDSNHRSFWSRRRVFVTGCTGLVGSWLADALVSTGARIVGLVRDTNPNSELVRSGNSRRIITVRGDLTDYQQLERILAEYEIDTVFHLAAQTIAGVANRAPLSTLETNIRGSWTLLEAARNCPTIKSIVVASSDTAYGKQAETPYSEQSPLQGLYPYDVSKACADMIARSYAHTYDLPVVVTRCTNLYGGGDLNWSRLIPGTVRSVLRGERPIIRSNGLYQRDYLYVKDAVNGYMLAAMKCFNSEIHGEAINLGCEFPITAIAVVQHILELAHREDLSPIILNEARHEVDIRYLSAAKARTLLGWTPSYAFEDGCRETIDWYRHYLGS